MKIALKTIFTALLLFPPVAAARAEAFIGGGMGLSWMAPTVAQDQMDSWHRDNYGAARDCELLDCSTPSTQGTTMKLFGGYRFNPYFAVEGFAADFSGFGGSADDGVSVSPPLPASTSVRWASPPSACTQWPTG